MNRKLLRRIAKIHGVTVQEVRRDMQAYIDHEFKNFNGVKPNTDDIIGLAVQKIKLDKKLK